MCPLGLLALVLTLGEEVGTLVHVCCSDGRFKRRALMQFVFAEAAGTRCLQLPAPR